VTETLVRHAYQRDDSLWVIPRHEFARERFHYEPGDHVVFGGPSQIAGKTTLAFDLLAVVATPECPAWVVVSKPTDKVTAERGAKLEFRRVRDWPVPPKLSETWNGKPRGYLIWPAFGDINTDMDRAAGVTARFMADRYSASARGKEKHTAGIMVMDDTMVKAKIMHLDGQMVTILAMAGAMDIGLWVFVQKPTDSGRTPLWAYENSQHFFFAGGGTINMRKRYAEIAGLENREMIAILDSLRPFQFLYVNKRHGYMCIVGAE
jgi:hypothetical protein